MARESKKRTIPWRLIFGLMVAGLVSAAMGMAAVRVRRFALDDPQFTLTSDHKDALVVQGIRYASRAKVFRVFTPDFEHSIFSVPLAGRRRELLAIDWIEDASVSRIWPDRLVVRIHERQPIAFVSLPTGVLLIDGHGVLLDPPVQAQFAFPVLSGIRESDSLPGRRERVRTFLRVEDDMGYLMKDISEVDVSDPDSIRIVAQVGSRALELLVGDSDFGRRYQNFLSHYPEIEKHSPEVKLFDLRLEDRITAKQ
ncbi:MAG: FtsQ-type POTRA domain-containing protein [Acidobacteriia bacterium]|nr:FtsQ-type POTRA domain-containing protein [Terriglobia bacterium]MBV8907202.1 FtsQ-type POTRA domain-containing protein [Terriglobia bacterium]